MHPLIENYPDYDAVLIRTDTGMAKDERFIIRAFSTFGFEDVSTGDDLEFRHIETDVTMSCDGDSIAIYKADSAQQIVGTYSDLFMILRNLEWTKAKLYCTGDASERLHELAGFIPASYDTLDLSLGVEANPLPEVDDLREAIQNHQSAPEPVLSLAELAAAAAAQQQAEQQSLEPAEEFHAVDLSLDMEANLPANEAPASVSPVMVTVEPIAADVSLRAEEQIRPPHVPADAPMLTDQRQAQQHSDEQLPSAAPAISSHALETLATALSTAIANQSRQTDRVLDLLQLVLMEKNMNHFAAALPSDALLVALIEKATPSALAKFGFTQNLNVWVHEEFGLTVDAGFIVVTKDVADPVWVNEFLTKLGGKIRRLWQAEASLVGMVMEERMSPAKGSEMSAVNQASSLPAANNVTEALMPEGSFPPPVADSAQPADANTDATVVVLAQSDVTSELAGTAALVEAQGEQLPVVEAAEAQADVIQSAQHQLSPAQLMVAEQVMNSMTVLLAEVFKLQDTRALIEGQMKKLDSAVNGQIHLAPGFVGTGGAPGKVNGSGAHHAN